jgi:hypothetical protein
MDSVEETEKEQLHYIDISKIPSSELELPPFDANFKIPPENAIQTTHGVTYYELKEPQGPCKGMVVLLHGISWASYSFYFLSRFLQHHGFRVLTFGNEHQQFKLNLI